MLFEIVYKSDYQTQADAITSTLQEYSGSLWDPESILHSTGSYIEVELTPTDDDDLSVHNLEILHEDGYTYPSGSTFPSATPENLIWSKSTKVIKRTGDDWPDEGEIEDAIWGTHRPHQAEGED